MPASRWNVDLNHMLYETETEEGNFEEIYLGSTDSEFEGLVEEQTGPEPEFVEESTVKLPDVLPILPLRGLVVYPQTGVPLTIGQPRSIRLVDDVVALELRHLDSLKAAVEAPGGVDLGGGLPGVTQ